MRTGKKPGGLWDDGWALAGTDDGQTTFPLWPARTYAALCAEGMWQAYEPTPIPTEDLVDELLPKLHTDGILVSVFMTPACKGVPVDAERVRLDLEQELEQY